MNVIFIPDLPVLRWCTIENGIFAENKLELKSDWQNTLVESLGNLKNVESVGYLLYHGGEEITKPANRLLMESLPKIEKCVRFLPEHNDLTYKLAKYWLKKLPNAQHILFCDTAFFLSLPSEASTYAVPYKLRQKGVRRYGGYGLCHQRVWEKTTAVGKGAVKKVISIYLGNNTNIAAIKNGQPLETTLGFTLVEGIPSARGCGEIDPTIIFQLRFLGMTFDEINQLLSRESGFTGLLGRGCGFLDIVPRTEIAETNAVREVFRYSVLKYIGASISVLGGVDALVFASEYLVESLPFIEELCQQLEFLGLKFRTVSEENKKFWALTEESSSLKVFCLKYSPWEMLAEHAANFLGRLGGTKW